MREARDHRVRYVGAIRYVGAKGIRDLKHLDQVFPKVMSILFEAIGRMNSLVG